MKKKFFKKIGVAIIAFVIVTLLYGLIVFIIRKYGTTNLENRKFNMLISGSNEISPSGELAYALQWYGNWDNMFLTDNFKQKYKNRKGILADVSKLKNISGFFDHNYLSNKKIIGIYGTLKRDFFQMLDRDYVDIDRVYYFDYKVDENGYLDDIELVGQQDFDAETGFPIGIDDREYHTIS